MGLPFGNQPNADILTSLIQSDVSVIQIIEVAPTVDLLLLGATRQRNRGSFLRELAD